MSAAAALITSFIEGFPVESLFTTRALLHLGTRAEVDNTTSNLVKAGKIKRVSRGVFSHPEKTSVSVYEVAKVKAESFGRKIITHAKDIAKQMGFSSSPENNEETKEERYYATDGRTSKFKFGSITIHFKSVSLKKMQLGDSPVGQAIRVLYHLGKSALKSKSVEIVAKQLDKSQIGEIIRKSAFMPCWLSDIFHTRFAHFSQQKIESLLLYEANADSNAPKVKESIPEYKIKRVSLQPFVFKEVTGARSKHHPVIYA